MSFSLAYKRLVHITGTHGSTMTTNNKTGMTRLAMTTTKPTTRALSYYGQQPRPPQQGNYGPPPLRAYPSYQIVAESFVMSMKLIPPQFRILRNNILGLDPSKKGRIMLEWAPRSPDGVVNWADRKNVIRFALSAEEIGYLLHQLPDNDVQFSRKQFPPEQQGTVMDDGITETSTEPIKVFRMKSGEAGIVSLSVDYELNGVGGQQLSTVETGQGPMEVTAQLGEFQVIRELMRTSIPLLTGWETLTGVTMQRQMEMTFSGAFNPQTSTYNE